jgi:hypothetical protein
MHKIMYGSFSLSKVEDEQVLNTTDLSQIFRSSINAKGALSALG